jgi:NADH-quinone oxidoreductase subunit G
MPTIKIGDKLCSFEGKKTILQVAQENGVEIPSYCYHPGLSVVASCRICLAEVAQPNPKTGQLEKIPKLVPTCQQPAADGMEVYTKSDKTVVNQKAVMEYLLINHPLDCPVCDQAGECYLQDYSYEYGRGHSRFEETKVKQPKKDVGPHVLLYSDRCIMCTRCVRFTREVTGTAELGVMGRGCKEEIDVFPGRALDNELSANVVDLCPVGALLDKDFLFEQRVWYLTSTPTIDGITASGDNIWLDHNQGRIYRLKPRTNLDVNKWWTSDEIRYGWKFIHDPARLTKPMVNANGTQVEAEWSVAYNEALRGLRGATAAGRHIGLVVSPMLSCEDAYLLGKFIKSLDAKAVFAVGPVPHYGQDKTFPGGYTIYAEKVPNARGVKRVLEKIAGAGNVLDYPAFEQRLNQGVDLGAVLLTGNYPSAWATSGMAEAIAQRFVVLLDTMPTSLSARANVVLPSVTWAEKAGTFENIKGRLQSFNQAIPTLEFARPEGQIGIDLLAAAGLGEPRRYSASATRQEIGGEFVTDVKHPSVLDVREPDMQFVEI